MVKHYFLISCLVALIFLIFKNWLSFYPLASGDWSYFYPSSLSSFKYIPQAWDTYQNTGLGGSNLYTLGLVWYFCASSHLLFETFHIHWEVIEKLVWFLPMVIISTLSSLVFAKSIIKNNFYFFAPFIFLLNTYILMVVGGGQMGVAVAYSVVPLVILAFVNLIDSVSTEEKKPTFNIYRFRLSLICGITLAVLLLFDIRVTYISLLAVVLYFIFSLFFYKKIKNTREIFTLCILIYVIPFLVTVFLHLFWILPAIVYRADPITSSGVQFSSTGAVNFFSFANLEQSVSLLHPNWPENIFGKVGFMKPEFLLLPILAYSIFLFKVPNLKSREKKPITVFNRCIVENQLDKKYIYFAILGLIGAFFAKGSTEPFGGIYTWFFEHVPGFVMFRDPTKWYILTVISYTILIPTGIAYLFYFLKSIQGPFYKLKLLNKLEFVRVEIVFLLGCIFFFLFVIRPALMGELNGTFKYRSLPYEYIKLENYIASQPSFYRILWIPQFQKYGTNYALHRSISGKEFFNVQQLRIIVNKLNEPKTQQLLKESSVKYVVVPDDVEGEIFLEDRKYNKKLYEKTISDLRKNKWLKEILGFGKIKVFETKNYYDHFFSLSKNFKLDTIYENQSDYVLHVENVKKGERIVFSEQFNGQWNMINNTHQIHSEKYKLFNSFILPQSGSYDIQIVFSPQKFVSIGFYISVSVFLLIVSWLAFSIKRKKLFHI